MDTPLTRGEAGSCSWLQKAIILTEACKIASNANTWGVKIGAGQTTQWADAPHTGMHTPIVTIEDEYVDGPLQGRALRACGLPTVAPDVTGRGGHPKTGGFAWTCWRWTLVNGS